MRAPSARYWRLTSLEEFDGTDLVVERQLRQGRRRARRRRRVGRRHVELRADVHHLGAGRDLAAERLRAPTLAPMAGVRGPLRRGLRHAHRRQRRRHERRPHLPGRRRPRPASTDRPISPALAGDVPTTSPTDSSSSRTTSAPRCGRSPQDSPRAPTPRPSRPAPCRTTCARSPTRSTCSDGHSDDALETFLFHTKTGYCEQFAGAFAAMARSIGLPARVAVGLHPGRRRPRRPRALPRPGRARPRLARGVPRRRRLGALRAHARAAARRTPRATPACPSSRPPAAATAPA